MTTAAGLTTATDLGFGTDVSTFVINDEGRPDLDANFNIISGPRVVLEQIMRGWLADRGTVLADASIGLGLRNWLSAGFDDSPTALDSFRSELVLEALRDPRVQDMSVAVTIDRPNERIAIAGVATLQTDEKAPFVLTIDKVTPTLVLGTVT